MSSTSEYKTSFIESIKLARNDLEKLSKEAGDETNPNNYIGWFDEQEHVMTFFQMFCKTITVKKSKYIKLQGDSDIILYKGFSPLYPKKIKVTEPDGTISVVEKYLPIEHISIEKERGHSRVQFSNFRTHEFYQGLKGCAVKDILDKRVSRSPLTKIKGEKNIYQRINKKYIEYVCNKTGSRFIPDLCEYMIDDLAKVTPEKIVDIFASHTVQFANFISYLSRAKIGNSFDLVRKIFKSTRKNIIFVNSSLFSIDVAEEFSATTSTQTLFNERVEKHSDKSKTFFTIDIVRFFLHYNGLYTKIIESTNGDVEFYNSYEDHLQKNETYQKYKSLIDIFMDKSGDFVGNFVSDKLSGDMMSGAMEKIMPFLNIMGMGPSSSSS